MVMAGVPMTDAAAGADAVSGVSHQALSPSSRRVLQAIYDLLCERSAWPTFRAVDLRFDRRLGIPDAQAALAAVPARYLQRSWRSSGFYDNDEVRLSLRGIHECDGGPADLELLARYMQWLCGVEQSQDPDDESDLIVESVDFAAVIGLPVQADNKGDTAQEGTPEEQPGRPEDLGDAEARPESAEGDEERQAEEEQPISAEVAQNRATLARLRVLADLLPRFASGMSWQEPWRWSVTIDRRWLRPYRDLRNVSQLLDYVDHEREILRRQQAALRVRWDVQSQDAATFTETEQVETIEEPSLGAGEIDVLLTVLRPEIADAAGGHVRGERYDDAIFAAHRRVEAAVQERSGLTGTIGDQLVRQAFTEIATPIRVSSRNQDADRLVQLFGGAIGLYKGDRSHKDKPALPCRSLRECLRLLANASALLDLLDRDIAVAPTVRGYDQRGDTLEIRVDRASAQAQVWLDDRLCNVIRHSPGSLILDVAGVPAGEHELFIADGTRAGPVSQAWLTRSPGGTGWYRVIEVNIPLFAGPTGPDRLDVTGMRLTARESGVTSERIVPTTGTFRVGDYVNWHFDVSAPGGDPSGSSAVGPVWMDDGPGDARRRLWESSALFDGQPYAPAHEPRLVRITLEPPVLTMRPNEKAPVRVLGHYTDGVATWTEPLTGCKVTTDSEEIVHAEAGKAIAKGHGKTAIRLTNSGLYAAATVHVAAHPTGTITDLLTGLPPVAGIAWADNALIVSTRTDELWRLDADGRYTLAAGVPLQPPGYGGTDNIAAAENGDLVVRLVGHREVLVLDKASGYCKSRWVSPGENGTVMAMTWRGSDLILALHTGAIRCVDADGNSKRIAMLPRSPIVSIDCEGDALLALTRDQAPELSRISFSEENKVTSVFIDQKHFSVNVVAALSGSIYFTDFNAGRLLRLSDEGIIDVATGLRNPGQLTAGPDGSVYIAEFGRGAVRRVLP